MQPFSVSLILAAAGNSTRFGSDKLGQDLGGRPLLLRSVELFTKRDEVRSIIVAAPPENMSEFRDRFGAQLSFHGVTLVSGGTIDRWETIRNALKAVPADATHIAVHDAARPATSDDLISRVFEAAKLHDAVIPALNVADTLKRVSEESVEAQQEDSIADSILGEDAEMSKAKGRFVQATVDRRNLVAVQTPQVFKADVLRRAYAQTDLSGVWRRRFCGRRRIWENCAQHERHVVELGDQRHLGPSESRALSSWTISSGRRWRRGTEQHRRERAVDASRQRLDQQPLRCCGQRHGNPAGR